MVYLYAILMVEILATNGEVVTIGMESRRMIVPEEGPAIVCAGVISNSSNDFSITVNTVFQDRMARGQK